MNGLQRATALVAVGLAAVGAVYALGQGDDTEFGTHTAQCLTHRPMDAPAPPPWTASVDLLYLTPSRGDDLNDAESGSFNLSSRPLSIEWPPDPSMEVVRVDDSMRLIAQQLTMMVALGCSGETV